jgi:predicted alpha/beta-hydrolase family hydrolase
MIEALAEGGVRGFLHRPERAGGDAIVLTHGAGSNCGSALLVAVASELERAGLTVLRCDLPFRQARPGGPPRPGDAARDRDGLREAVAALRRLAGGRVYLGGHSYGGRQATMLAAAEPGVAEALLLLSYPLHPPRKPAELRTAHFPKLVTPALFVHGSRDGFGTIDEMRRALALIPAPVELVAVEGAGHDLKAGGAAALAVKHFLSFLFSRYNSR